MHVVSFGTNVITSYALDDKGKVLKTLGYEGVKNSNPANDLKDIIISKDEKYAYCLGALQTYTLKRFEIVPKGLKYLDEYQVKETEKVKGQTGVYDFQGLVSFDLK